MIETLPTFAEDKDVTKALCTDERVRQICF